MLCKCCIDSACYISQHNVAVVVKTPSEATTNVQQPHVMATSDASVKDAPRRQDGLIVCSQIAATAAYMERYAHNRQTKPCGCVQQCRCIRGVCAILKSQLALCLGVICADPQHKLHARVGSCDLQKVRRVVGLCVWPHGV